MFTSQEILEVTHGVMIGSPVSQRARRVVTDSRLVKRGDVFIAIKGDKFDGHDFVEEVLKRGAKVVLVERPVSLREPKAVVIQVPNTLRAMGQLAKYHRQRFSFPVIAITGSAGKTTTKEMLTKVLRTRLKVLSNPRSFNNHIGVPLTVFQMNASHEIAVIECGTNQPGDIRYLADIVRPDMVVMTVIGESHLEKLKTLQGVLKEKWQLTRFLGPGGRVVVNADDLLLGKKMSDPRVMAVGQHPLSRWRAKNIHVNARDQVEYEVKSQRVTLRTSAIHQVNNSLLALAVGCFFGVKLNQGIDALQHFSFPQGRGQIKKVSGITVIDDAYNANPLSLRAAIDLLSSMKAQGRRVLVVGDMYELGTQARALHMRLGVYVASRKIDLLVTVGTLAKWLGDRARQERHSLLYEHCQDTQGALRRVPGLIHRGDVVLVKGSHAIGLERLVQHLVKSKGK